MLKQRTKWDIVVSNTIILCLLTFGGATNPVDAAYLTERGDMPHWIFLLIAKGALPNGNTVFCETQEKREYGIQTASAINGANHSSQIDAIIAEQTATDQKRARIPAES